MELELVLDLKKCRDYLLVSIFIVLFIFIKYNLWGSLLII